MKSPSKYKYEKNDSTQSTQHSSSIHLQGTTTLFRSPTGCWSHRLKTIERIVTIQAQNLI